MIKILQFISITSLMIITLNSCSYNTKFNDESTVDSTEYNSTEYNLKLRDSIRQFIKFMNLDHPDIVYAQATLESSHFSSDIFIENYNMFGMKEAMVRNSVALGTKNGFAYYKNWQHSIIDYALYQATYYHTSARKFTRQEYLEKLARTYAEDPNYIKKINSITKNEN